MFNKVSPMRGRSLKDRLEQRPSDSTEQKILTAAVELFFEQGYGKTTTRQIVQKAGVLNGSMYYFFKGKDSILESIVMTQLEQALAYADESLESTDSPMTVLLFPLGIELYTAEHSRKAADLLFHAHSSQEITDAIVGMICGWVSAHYAQYSGQVSSSDFRLNVLAIVSIMRSFVGCYATGTAGFHYADCLRLLVKMTSVFFQIPVFDADSLVKDICCKVETEKIVIGGSYLEIEIHDIDDMMDLDRANLSSEAK